MKPFTVMTSMLCALVLTACAGMQEDEDKERYDFENLQQVKAIQDYRLNGWNVIDSQSLVINTGPQTHYLLILQRKLTDLRFAENILISSTAGRVQAKFDTVATPIVPQNEVAIERIYKLDNREQVDMVRRQIRGED